MAKTVFDSADLKRKTRQQELEAELTAIREGDTSDFVPDIPEETELSEVPTRETVTNPDILEEVVTEPHLA